MGEKIKKLLTGVLDSENVALHTANNRTTTQHKTMRTKVLLSLAAFAVSAFAAYAQSNVYSVNVVGYVNKSLPAGSLQLVANPLDAGTNDLATVLAALPNKSSALRWTGSGFQGANKALGVWSTNFAVAPGMGFFVNSFSAVTNTFVGEVIVGPGETNSMALSASVLQLVGSPIPYAGNLNDAYNTESLNLGATLPNKSSVLQWTGGGYAGANKALGTWTPNLSLGVAEGFFVTPFSATNWVQSLPAN